MSSGSFRLAEQIDWCIRWEKIRAEYFLQIGDNSKLIECIALVAELKDKHPELESA